MFRVAVCFVSLLWSSARYDKTRAYVSLDTKMFQIFFSSQNAFPRIFLSVNRTKSGKFEAQSWESSAICSNTLAFFSRWASISSLSRIQVACVALYEGDSQSLNFFFVNFRKLLLKNFDNNKSFDYCSNNLFHLS